MLLRVPPPRSCEDTYLGLARQLYVDGKLDIDEFEHALEVILAGGSIYDAVRKAGDTIG